MFTYFFLRLRKRFLIRILGVYFAIQSFSCHWSLSIPPENTRKPDVFLMFSEGIKDEWPGHGIG